MADEPRQPDRGWDGTTPTHDEYVAAARRLMEKALKSGDGEALRDVKILMDANSAAASAVVKMADQVIALSNG